MQNYREAYDRFDLDETTRRVLRDDVTSANACVVCCDRFADDPARVALRFESQSGTSATFTFAQLREGAARFAGLLAGLGVEAGDCVAALLPRTPELLFAILGTWRCGAVYQPLFTAFGPKAIEHRLSSAGTRLVVTNAANRSKLDEVKARPTIVTVGAEAGSGDIDFATALQASAEEYTPVPRALDAPILMMFTSGTTGAAKQLAVPLKAIVAFEGYMRDCIDLRPEDRFWNIADPGWAYGLYYAVTGPLAMGHATTFYDGPFSVEKTYDVIERLGITNLAGSPTAFRQFIAAGPELASRIKGRLRVVSSAGEPLNPEVIRWFAEHLGVTVHDHYGQTELGMVLGNHHALEHPVHPGSAGFAIAGHRVVIVDESGTELPAGQPGILALDRKRSPLMWFSGYSDNPNVSFVGDYYLSGDTVEAGADGSISFIGRSDDVITSSGYRIGPFDVESALLEHPAVSESAVVGKPDPERTEIVKAFVVLAAGWEAGDELAEELRAHVKHRLSAHAYPREFAFVKELPKTPSGKLQRFILRQDEIAKSASLDG